MKCWAKVRREGKGQNNTEQKGQEADRNFLWKAGEKRKKEIKWRKR